MDETPNLGLPYIMAAQSQKHVTHNEAIRALDAIVQLSVLDRGLSAPPDSPAEGARYIVGPGPSGAWSGHAGHIAAYQDGAWMLYAPSEGWIAWIADEDIAVVWNGSAWGSLATGEGGGGGGGGEGDFATLGINAAADETNRLSLASAASLFNHDGDGHQLKINKAAAGNTASLLYQTAFSGRAELGLAGDDDFHFKVSPDGSTWNEAIVIDKDTGEVTFPHTALGGGGSGAPTDAEYIVKSANGSLSAERVLTDTATVAWDYATGGQAKANVPDDAVTDAKLRDSAAVSVIGRAANASGDPADIAAAANDTILRRTSDALSFGQITVGMLPNDVVTYAKMQNVSATDTLLGRASSGAGDIEEIACTAFARSVLDDADAAAARTTLGVAIGSNVQAYHSYLADISALTPEDGEAIVWDGIAGHWVALAIEGGEGGGGGAPTGAEYIVKSSNGSLSAERVLTDTTSLAWDYGIGGQAKGNVQVSAQYKLLGRKSSGAGNVEELTFTDIFAFGDAALQELLLSHSLLALQVADLSNAAIFTSANRVADSFDALTYVDTGGATNLDTGASGVLKPSLSSSQVAQGTGTAIGDLVNGGGLSAAFDGNTNQDNDASAAKNVSTSGYNNAVGKDWGSGNTKTISRFKIYAPNNAGLLGGGGGTTIKLQGSSNGSAWTDLYTSPGAVGAVGTTVDVASGIDTSTAYRYHRVNLNGNGSNGCLCAEVQFYEISGVNNVTVCSTVFTAASVPSVMKTVIRVKEVEAATANTDYTLEFSRDGGTTWTLAALTERLTVPGSIRVCETGLVDISSQPSGTSLRWRWKTANGKMIELHDVLVYWQ